MEVKYSSSSFVVKVQGLVLSKKPHSIDTVNCANNFKVLRSLSTQSSWPGPAACIRKDSLTSKLAGASPEGLTGTA
eukprot:1162093-Pelagomonas_calceolata.AAC.13